MASSELSVPDVGPGRQMALDWLDQCGRFLWTFRAIEGVLWAEEAPGASGTTLVPGCVALFCEVVVVETGVQ